MWQNWSGRQRAEQAQLHFVRSEQDAAACLQRAHGAGRRVRVAGSGHSHSPLVPCDDVVLDCSGLTGVIDIDAAAQRAWVWAGTPIYALGNALNQAGLALHNQGDIDRQALAGATATGTHGTGRRPGNLSTAVCGLKLLSAAGEPVEIDPAKDPDRFAAARLSLGAVGVVTQIQLQLRERYVLQEQSRRVGVDEIEQSFDELANKHRHAEFFWYPGNDQAQLKVIDEVDVSPEYPLADEGSRCAWSHEVLPNHRPHRHTEMEYSVPAADGMACFLELRELLRSDFPEVRWPVEYRTLAADDVWLSTAYERDTVTLSVHQTIDEDETPYYRACEALFDRYGGRPHWGKLHYQTGQTLQRLYPRYAQWWQVRDALDPRGLLLNDHLEGLRP